MAFHNLSSMNFEFSPHIFELDAAFGFEFIRFDWFFDNFPLVSKIAIIIFYLFEIYFK